MTDFHRHFFRSSSIIRRVGGCLLIIVIGLMGVLGYWLSTLDQEITERMSSRQWALPARVFARPLELYPGKTLALESLLQEIHWLGYREGPIATPGHYQKKTDSLMLHTRGFDFNDTIEAARIVQTTWSGDRLAELQITTPALFGVPEAESGETTAAPSDDEKTLDFVRLEPLEIGAIHPDSHEDRILVATEEMPAGFITALTTVEDKQFFDHHGVSLRGILRAVWINVRSGSKRQGASTITQQLVKNLFLTNEKSWTRKATEAWMALIMELRYPKETILETFANEVFITQDGNRAIHGFGLASQYFFGRPLRELQPHQYALLIGMLKAPTAYNPIRHTDAATKRRNLVLRLMLEADALDASDYAVAIEQDLGIDASYRAGGNPAYLDAVKRQLLTDYAADDLQTAGLRVFTSFDPLDQKALEDSVAAAMAGFTRRFGASSMPADFLEVAAVVTDPNTGDIRAMLGGQDSRFAGFNRALDAKRPVGSLLKPAIYLTALQQPKSFTLATLLDDEPIALPQRDGSIWTPENFDGETRGKVSMLEALTRSLNLASVNLGLQLGLPAVIDTLANLGIDAPLPEIPSLLLGAHGFSVMDMARLYQTIAADGFTVPLNTIRDVLDAENESLTHFPIDVVRKIDDSSSYLLKYAMSETMRIGTGRSAYTILDRDFSVAGKTGTSDGQRDSWFAGYSGDTLAVIWLGNDRNAKTPLTGSSGALQVWSELLQRVSDDPITLSPPADIVFQPTDLSSGRRVIGECASAYAVPYISGSEPLRRTRCRTPERKSWLRTLFNRD